MQTYKITSKLGGLYGRTMQGVTEDNNVLYIDVQREAGRGAEYHEALATLWALEQVFTIVIYNVSWRDIPGDKRHCCNIIDTFGRDLPGKVLIRTMNDLL